MEKATNAYSRPYPDRLLWTPMSISQQGQPKD